MSFFTSNLFWFIEGILLVVVILSLKSWMTDKNIKLNIWNWITIILWILFLEFTIAFVTTSLGEGESTAATLGGVLFGLLSIISGVALFRFIFSKKVKPSVN